MLKGQGRKILGTGETTDKIIKYYGWGNSKRLLKVIAVKGYINDWVIYIELMEKSQTYREVKNYGNKIYDRKMVKQLVDCDEEVLERYRK